MFQQAHGKTKKISYYEIVGCYEHMLLKNDDSDWHHTVLRIIEWFGSCWGGCHGIMVRTGE